VTELRLAAVTAFAPAGGVARLNGLLSSEVGLGETIEAGAVIRQFLLDVPRGRS